MQYQQEECPTNRWRVKDILVNGEETLGLTFLAAQILKETVPKTGLYFFSHLLFGRLNLR